MTTIATDGRTIASDSLMSFGHERSLHPSKKIHVGKGAIYATCGLGGLLEVLAKWHEDGAKPDAVPKTGGDEEWAMLVITRAGMSYIHSKALFAVPVAPPFSIGGGGEFATGAMEAGATPERAVEIACRRSNKSGLPVQVVDIAEALGIKQLQAAE